MFDWQSFDHDPRRAPGHGRCVRSSSAVEMHHHGETDEVDDHDADDDEEEDELGGPVLEEFSLFEGLELGLALRDALFDRLAVEHAFSLVGGEFGPPCAYR